MNACIPSRLLVMVAAGLAMPGIVHVTRQRCYADEPKAQGKAATSPAAPGESSEELVLEFVQQHQPELARLILFLKTRQPDDYRQAIRESRKVRERLLTIQDRDPELYEVELSLWKISAELRLLAAAVAAKGQATRDSKQGHVLSDAEREKVTQLLTRENELSIRRLTLEKARVEARLNQLSQQLSKRQEQSASVIAKGLKTWENRIERSGKKAK